MFMGKWKPSRLFHVIAAFRAKHYENCSCSKQLTLSKNACANYSC